MTAEYFLGAATLLVFVAALYAIRRFRIMRGFSSLREGAYTHPAESLRNILLVFAFLSASLGYSTPKEEVTRSVPDYEGLDIIAMVDCSKSMLASAKDGKPPSRMDVVVSALLTTVRALEKDRWGISCFSEKLLGTPILSTDYEHVLYPKLRELSNASYLSQVGRGTDFSAALDGCRRGFMRTKKKMKKICMIFSDGEPQGNEEEMDKRLDTMTGIFGLNISEREWDIAFYLIGVGDMAHALKIPEYDAGGNVRGFETDEKGNEVYTRPDRSHLQKIAGHFAGEYRQLSKDEDLSAVVDDIAQKERRVIGQRLVTSSNDKPSYPLVAVALLFLFGFIHCPRHLLRRTNA